MRTKITLHEFLYVMNQDEDIRVTLSDFDAPIGKDITTQWKSSLIRDDLYQQYKNWYVQDFVCVIGGLEIVITDKELED